MIPAALVLTGFLFGSIPFSFLVGKLRGLDLRREGSGNIGATNLLRSCGKACGILGLLLDAAKGALPVLAALELLQRGPLTASLTAAAAVLGHVLTPWLGFRGGKGVATALGGLAVLAPFPVLASVAVFVLAVAIFRMVSLGSVLAAAALVPLAVLLPPDRELPVIIACALVAAVVLVRHRSNILRIVSGNEPKLDWGGRKV